MRALAILGIVFYHLNASYCPAGYFGVDVFLVISGYFLLASLMKAEHPSDVHYGTYLLKKSWRILPSWFLVTLVFFFGSAWFMIPVDRIPICNTGIRSAFFAADFYIDRQYDYFNQRAHENLFLHYWYLSIICQMYIIVPLLLMLMLRFFSKKATVLVLGVIGLLSLILYVLTTSPQLPESIRQPLMSATGMKTVYYHLLPRLWEIFAGGAVLLLPSWTQHRALRAVMETLGALLILVSFYHFSTGSPQVYAAVTGSVLFIRYGGEGPVARLLSWRPLQWVGTISFSLYLWHWPVMAAWKYVALDGVNWSDECAMLLLSFLLGFLAWRYIESLKMPASCNRLMTALRFLPVLMLLFFAVATRPYYKGVRASIQDGLKGKGLLPEMVDEINVQPRDEQILKGFSTDLYHSQPAYIGEGLQVPPSFLLLGDSHSAHSFHGLHKYCTEQGIRGIHFNNTIPLFWWCHWEYKDGSSGWNEKKAGALMEYIHQHPSLEYVFMTMLWQPRLYGAPAEVEGETMDWREMRLLSHEEQNALREAGLRETCRRLTEMGKKVILLEDVPTLPRNFAPYYQWLKRKMLRGEDSPEYLTPVSQHKEKAGYAALFSRLLKEGVVWAVIDCAEPLRQGEYYRTRNDAGEFLYSDNNHITYAGSELVGQYVMEEWQRLQREKGAGKTEKPEAQPAAP